jgi:hypothetical protein
MFPGLLTAGQLLELRHGRQRLEGSDGQEQSAEVREEK